MRISLRLMSVVAAAPTLAASLTISPAADAAVIGASLPANTSLGRGDSLVSANGAYQLILQTDGNLVEYGPAGALWATYTGDGGSLSNQTDGNLVLYRSTGGDTWASRTNGRGASTLVVQDDGNVVLYGPSGPTWSTYTNGGVSRLAAAGAVAYAKKQLGKPYSSGAAGPNAFDCSALVMSAYASVGVNLPRRSYEQSRAGFAVDRNSLQPGDLVFYNSASHVGIYVGNGEIIDALNRNTPVSYHSLTYAGTISGYRRVA